jgi:ABC-type Fe3+-siderophore transport system permease subunit
MRRTFAPAAVDVLLHARGPRVLAAVGAALSVAGAALQGL